MARMYFYPAMFVALVVCCGLAAAGCTDHGSPVAASTSTGGNNGTPPPPPPPTNVSFSTQVQPVFTSSCALNGCHAGTNPQAGMSLESGKAYANIVDVVSTSYSPAKRVAPGDTTASVLYNKIRNTGVYGQDMPPGPPALTASQIMDIGVWIEEGAQNN